MSVFHGVIYRILIPSSLSEHRLCQPGPETGIMGLKRGYVHARVYRGVFTLDSKQKHNFNHTVSVFQDRETLSVHFCHLTHID